MNASHRSIWNDALEAWVAAPELTSARGKRNHPSARRRPRCSSVCSTPLQALAAAAITLLSVSPAGAQTNLGGGLGGSGEHIAIGSTPAAPCTVQADSAYKLGGGSSVLSSGALAMGVDSIAIGTDCAYPTAALGTGSFALGVNAFSAGSHSFAMGRDARATGALSQAWGYRANASGTNALAFGSASMVGNVAQNDAPVAAAADAIAIGRGSNVSSDATGGIAIGLGSNTQISGATAIGGGARVLASSGRVAEGVVDRRAGDGGSSDVVYPTSGSASSFPAGVAVGATTAYDGSVSVGFNNVAGDTVLHFHAVALGNENLANGAYATGLGTGNTASGIAAVALGVVNQASGNTAIAIGRQSYASGDFSIAQGNLATASDVNAIALGNSSGATAKGAIAIGGGSDGSTSLLDPTGSLASGVGAIAVGTAARATGRQSISIGTGNVVAGNNSGAFGDPSYINADSAYGIGNNNTIDSANSFVLGNNVAVASGLDGAVVLGNNSTVAASNPTAGITLAGTSYSFAGGAPLAGGVVSVGAAGAERQLTHLAAGRISATSTDAVNGSQLHAAGQAIETLNTAAVALGNTVTTLGTTLNNIAGNTSTSYTDANGVGIRYVRTNEVGLASTDAFASGQGATAVGYNALASAESALAVGRDATAAITGGVALGQGSVSDRTIAQGAGAVPGHGSVQFNTTGRTLLGAVSVGSSSGNTYRQITNVADGTQGQDAATVAQLGALSGTLAGTTSKYFHANSSAADSLSIGAESIAVGPTTVVNGDNAIGIGHGATVQMVATGGTAIGQAAAVSSVDGLAIGTQAKADAQRGVAIGAGATVSHADSVALGSNAITATGSQTGYTAYALTATQNSAGEVSVGRAGAERQITNVAGGSADTDAVNVAQLRAVATTANNAVQYGDAGKTTVTLAGPVSSDGGATGGTLITHLHQGALDSTSTDAVNGSQLFQTNTTLTHLGNSVTTLGNSVTALGNNVTNLGSSVTTLGHTLSNIAGDSSQAYTVANGTGIRYVRTNEAGLAATDAFATGQGATAVGHNASSAGAGAVALGRDASASVAGSVALGQGSVSDRAITPGSGIVPGFASVPYNTANGTLLGAVSLGSTTANTYRQITNLADGTQGQDAVSVSQLQALSGTLSNTAQKYFHANSNGPDALSGGAESVAVGPRTVVNGDSAIGIGNGATVQMVATGGTAIGQTAYVGQADGIALGSEARSDALRGVAIGAAAAVTHADSVALGAGAATSVGSQTGYTAYGLTAPQNSAGEVSVGRAGAERQVTNVAAGSADTDAVNVGQLKAVTTTANNSVQYDDTGKASVTLGGPASTDGGVTGGTTLTNLRQGSVAAGSTDAVNGSQLHTVQQQVTNLNNGAAGFFQVNDSARLGTPAATGINAVAGGAGSVASGDHSTALGHGASALASNAVAIGAGSVADRAGTVSVGSAGSERQVVNVAAGTAATDAVNVGQLQSAQAGNLQYDKHPDGSPDPDSVTLGNGQAPNGTVVSNLAPGVKGNDAVNVNQLNTVRDALDSRIDDVARNAYAGVAAAMAVQMPASYVPGKTVMRVGAAVFKGQTAVGLSFRRTAENNALSVSGGVGASRAGVAATVGAEWVFN